jgi:hypothetical protein
MDFNTIDTKFTYQVKEVLKEYKRLEEIDLEGEELIDYIWENKASFGEMFLDKICDFNRDLFDNEGDDY